ncbi:hypothetical protein EPUL_005181, partial [Erysiphe pulchra]
KLLHDVKERNALGASIESIYSIEYQKRGLPHLLLLLHPDDMPKIPEQIDEIVRAQIPLDNPELAAIVKSQLTHGPCGPEFPNAPCLRDGKCSKGFPKKFCDETTITEGSYPEYARPDNGVRWGSERFIAHINVEIAGGVRAIKYLAKYICKGSDRATLAGRYIGPSQAIWRLMGYATHEEKPAVMMLPFHLEGEYRVTFRTNQNQEQVVAGIESQSSVFLDWMRYNATHTDGRDLFYSDFPMHYTHVKNSGWHLRNKGHTIGRMPRGATSYEDLYTVDGVTYTTPSAACRAWGLTYDDSEWITLYNEVKDTTPAASLRYQFVVNLADSEILDPQRIWDLFQENFTDDCLYRIQTMGDTLLKPPDDWSDEERRINYSLWLLGENLRDFGMDFAGARIRGSRHRWVETELNQRSVSQLSMGQHAAYDIIIDTIDNNRRPNSFFLHGPAGT